MPIERSFEMDFLSTEICTWLGTTSNRAEKHSNREDISKHWSDEGYSQSGVRQLAPAQTSDRISFFETEYIVQTYAGRVIDKVKVRDLYKHACDLTISVLLFLKPSLDPAIAQDAKDAFANTDLGDVDSAEVRFIRAGLSMSDYQVVFFFDLARREDRILDDKNSRAFLQQIQDQREDNGKPIYAVEATGPGQHACTAPDIVQNDDDVIVGDPDHPEDDIRNYERENSNHRCEDMDVVARPLGQVFEFNEYKTVWEVRKVKIGRCTVMKTKLPIIKTRTNRQIAVAYIVTEKEVIRLFEKALEKCLKMAAIETAIIVIITGFSALAAAKALFIASCLRCLESEFSDELECLYPELKLVTDRTNWT